MQEAPASLPPTTCVYSMRGIFIHILPSAVARHISVLAFCLLDPQCLFKPCAPVHSTAAIDEPARLSVLCCGPDNPGRGGKAWHIAQGGGCAAAASHRACAGEAACEGEGCVRAAGLPSGAQGVWGLGHMALCSGLAGRCWCRLGAIRIRAGRAAPNSLSACPAARTGFGVRRP